MKFTLCRQCNKVPIKIFSTTAVTPGGVEFTVFGHTECTVCGYITHEMAGDLYRKLKDGTSEIVKLN